jgi:branched-chain amino acid transport system permease protein
MSDVDERRVTAPADERAELPARPVDLRRAARIGAIAAVVVAFASSIGMVRAFDERNVVGEISLGYVLLAGIAVALAGLGASPPARIEGYREARPGSRNVVAGLIVGSVGSPIVAVVVWFVDTVNVRTIFPNISPDMIELLTFGRGTAVGLAMIVGWGVVLGAVGGAAHLAPSRWRRAVTAAALWIVGVAVLESVAAQILRSLGLGGLHDALFLPTGALAAVGAAAVGASVIAVLFVVGPRARGLTRRTRMMPWPARRRLAVAGLAIGLFVLGALPSILGQFLTEVLNLVGIFMLMALGLNIVVGFAGLLDLGYVAFFAVGAYTTAVLTSPHSPRFSPELNFWVALPVVVLFGVVAGLFIGVPVLRMRGDYLAIVTLGFGEIARLLFLSDWLRPEFGGAQGIIRVPNIALGPVEIASPQAFFYMIFGLALIAAYVSYALQASRVGRAWNAIREDQTVAEAMGVNTVTSKLAAFAIGAVLASAAGALFATKIGSVIPASFGVDKSILVLIIVIIGGIGSVRGVALGALVLVGLPEILREFEEYRFLVYGALLIFMMLRRPEGLLPSARRAAELHEADLAQDAWIRERAKEQPEGAG